MKNDPLRQLIDDTDAMLGREEKPAPDMAARIRTEADRRTRRARRRAMAVGLVPLIAVVATCCWWAMRAPVDSQHVAESPNVRSAPAIEAESLSIEEIEQQIAELECEIALLRANAMPAPPRESTVTRRLLDELDIERERTAGIIVCAADMKRNYYGQYDDANERYAFVCATFPNSNWAKVASERLASVDRSEN